MSLMVDMSPSPLLLLGSICLSTAVLWLLGMPLLSKVFSHTYNRQNRNIITTLISSLHINIVTVYLVDIIL